MDTTADAPAQKMEQSQALRDFLDWMDALAKNNFFNVNLQFAVRMTFEYLIDWSIFRNYDLLRTPFKFKMSSLCPTGLPLLRIVIVT
jgi:hypothetical protein